MTKTKKSEPANLSEKQKQDIKIQILKQFPSLSLFNDEIEFLIEEYNKDKKYINRLMKSNKPIESVIDESKLEAIKVVKADTKEWHDIDEKMRKAREEFLKINEDDENEKSVNSI